MFSVVTVTQGWVVASNLFTSREAKPLFPGFAVTGYHVSGDGRRIVFSALDSSGKPRLWLASTDRRTPPRQIPNAEGDMPDFGPPGELIFHVVNGGSNFAFRIREDGTEMQKLISQQISSALSVSPGRQWVFAWSAVAGEESNSATQAFPIGGGPPFGFSARYACLDGSRTRSSFISPSTEA